MRIIARYITKEILLAFFAVTGILLFIVLTNRFAVYLAKAATGELPISFVCYIVGLFIPELLSYLIPLGLLIGILFSFGRLYAESEMTVLLACGVSKKYLIKLTLFVALIIAMLTAILTLWVVPKAALARQAILVKAETFALSQSLASQQFQTFGDGKLIFYLEDASGKPEKLSGAFIAERPLPVANRESGWTLITAHQGAIKQDEETGNMYLVLRDGHRYQGLPGAANYSVTDFKEYGRSIVIETSAEAIKGDSLRDKDTRALLDSTEAEDATELQWRLSLPLSVLILALIAVPLAEVKPRQGRFGRFLPALMIYIIYYNAFTICRRWVAAGVLPSFIGVWWVHAVAFLIGLGLVAKDCGWLRRKV
jgi:lipopolysaccharide export system permease protein